MPGVLDGSAIGERVAKRHSQLDDIGSALYGREREFDALGSRRESTHEIGHESATPFAFCLLESPANFQGRDGAIGCRWHMILLYAWFPIISVCTTNAGFLASSTPATNVPPAYVL